MWTNGSGTSSVKPPVRCCSSRTRRRWRAQLRGVSTWPNMIVAVERSPARCAVSCTSSHCAVFTLSGQRTRAHLVVEDLGGRARQRGEPDVAEPGEVVVERLAERRRALPDLERRERVHVQVGQLALDRLADLDVVVAVEARVDPALEADLDRAALPGLVRAADDLLGRARRRRGRAGSRPACPSRTRRSRT